MLLNGFAKAIKKLLMTMTVVDVDFLAPVDFKHVILNGLRNKYKRASSLKKKKKVKYKPHQYYRVYF